MRDLRKLAALVWIANSLLTMLAAVMLAQPNWAYCTEEPTFLQVALGQEARCGLWAWLHEWQEGWGGVLAAGAAAIAAWATIRQARRSEEHTSELQSLMRISYAVFCLKKKHIRPTHNHREIISNHER